MAAVLIVDDDADSREVLAKFLAKPGHAVTVAPNGSEAMHALSGNKPDVVILDYRMPKMDGITFLEVIRSYLRWQSLPVILVTAYPDGLHVKRANQLGVRKIFVKGAFDLADLLAHVEACTTNVSPDQTGTTPPMTITF